MNMASNISDWIRCNIKVIYTSIIYNSVILQSMAHDYKSAFAHNVYIYLMYFKYIFKYTATIKLLNNFNLCRKSKYSFPFAKHKIMFEFFYSSTFYIINLPTQGCTWAWKSCFLLQKSPISFWTFWLWNHNTGLLAILVFWVNKVTIFFLGWSVPHSKQHYLHYFY